MSDTLILEAIGASRDVILKTTNSGDIKLLLFEMDGDTHETFMSRHRRRLEIDGERASVKDMEGMRMELLIRACHIISVNDTPVPEKERTPSTEFFKKHGIRTGTIQRLYDEAMLLNRVKSNTDYLVSTMVKSIVEMAEADELTPEHRKALLEALETKPLGEN